MFTIFQVMKLDEEMEYRNPGPIFRDRSDAETVAGWEKPYQGEPGARVVPVVIFISIEDFRAELRRGVVAKLSEEDRRILGV